MALETDRLAKLKQQRAEIEQKIRRENARAAEQQRRTDTRRKIIAGGLVLKDMEQHPDSPLGKKMLRLLDEYVTRNQDRALFNLEPLPLFRTGDNDNPVGPEPTKDFSARSQG